MFLRHRSKVGQSRWAGFFRLLLIVSLGASVSHADVQLEGEGVLGRRNLSERSLEIGGTVFFFSRASVILDRQRAKVSLESLAVADAGGESRLLPIQSARYSAVEVRGRYVIQRLELMEGPAR